MATLSKMTPKLTPTQNAAPKEQSLTVLDLPVEIKIPITQEIFHQLHPEGRLPDFVPIEFNDTFNSVDGRLKLCYENLLGLAAGATNFMLVCREFCNLGREVLYGRVKYQIGMPELFRISLIPHMKGYFNASYIRNLCFELPIKCAVEDPARKFSAYRDFFNNQMSGLTTLVFYGPVSAWKSVLRLGARLRGSIRSLLMLTAAITASSNTLKKAVCAATPGYEVLLGKFFIKLMTRDRKHDKCSEFISDCKYIREQPRSDLLLAHPRHFALPDEAETSEPDPGSKKIFRSTRRKRSEAVVGSKSNIGGLLADWTVRRSRGQCEVEEKLPITYDSRPR